MTDRAVNIGVIAGSGFLPIEVIREIILKKNFCTVFVFKKLWNDILNNLTPEELKKIKLYQVDFKFSFQIINILKKDKIKEIVFCGKVKFNGIKEILPGIKEILNILKNIKYLFYIISLFGKVKKNHNKGDDFLLSILVNFCEKNNIKVLSVDSILTHTLCTLEDNAINNSYYDKDIKDGLFAIDILNYLSDLDIGQSVVVQNGRVIGVEAAEGTDELIKRCADMAKKNLDKKAIFCKSSKVNQNMQMDIAAIGCETLENINNAGYSSLVLKNKKVLIINREVFFQKLKEFKLNLIVL